MKYIENLLVAELIGLFYIDDGAIPFTSRKDMILGTKIVIKVFNKFRLIA